MAIDIARQQPGPGRRVRPALQRRGTGVRDGTGQSLARGLGWFSIALGLAETLAPRTLALMHGASYHGDGGRALRALADHYEAELDAAMLRRAA